MYEVHGRRTERCLDMQHMTQTTASAMESDGLYFEVEDAVR